MFDGHIIIIYSIFLSNILAILIVRTIIKQVTIVDVARYLTRRVRKCKQMHMKHRRDRIKKIFTPSDTVTLFEREVLTMTYVISLENSTIGYRSPVNS